MERKEILTLIISILVLIVMVTGTGLYFRSKKDNGASKAKEEITVVEGRLPTADDQRQAKEKDESETIGSTAFFLKPSAEEVLSALKEADPFSHEQPDEDRPPMKVMWPGYFFSVAEEKMGTHILKLDVDPNGFGVILLCRVKLSDYPEIKTLQQGQKIWVAGEVTSIDLNGTGSVSINVEYIRFDEGPEAARESRKKQAP